MISLSIGEPQHPVPDFVGPVLAASLADFNRYPAIRGTETFRKTIGAWLDRRYALGGAIDPERMVIPLNGSREGLFSAGLAAREWYGRKARPAVLLPNPFYPAYAAGAVVVGAETIALDCPPEKNSLPDLDAMTPELLDRAIAIYVGSPSNPRGSVADNRYWARLVELARQHDFMVFADECYSELYRSDAPPGVLATAAASGSFRNVVAFHSLSKRSNLAGLRVGFAAGDPDFIGFWSIRRNVFAPQVPMPMQAVAVAAYRDETHVEANRRLYNEKYEAAERILGNRFGYRTPPGGFFLWLDMSSVGGGETAALRLWREAGVRSLPGEYLALPRPDGSNPGKPFLRLAMVNDLAATREALTRLAAIFD